MPIIRHEQRCGINDFRSMRLTIAYSHRDIDQAERLLHWIRFLSARAGHRMKREKALLIPSRHAAQRRAHNRIVAVAEKTFGQVTVHVPRTEDERPWPFSPNFMFREALTLIERMGEDMFWLEPDAVPLTVDWWTALKKEWEWAQMHKFLGTYVESDPHMSGVGVYSHRWRDFAPSLATAENIPWDVHAREEVMRWAQMTNLIRHVWREPRISEDFLDGLAPEVRVFHQDKTGVLIRLLNERRFGGGFKFTQREEAMDTRYFHADNSNRTIESQGYQFRFEPYQQFAGTWRGTYAAATEGEQIALSALAASTGVTEITAEEYEDKTKKKVVSLPISRASNASPVTTPSLAKAQIKGERVAVVVDEPAPQVVARQAVEEKDVDALIKTGPVEMEQPQPLPPKKMRRKKAA